MGIGFEIPERKIKFGPQPGAPEWDDERIWNWGISTTRDFIARIKSQDPDTKGIRIRIDAVVFNDGSLAGSDAGNILRTAIESHVKARQDLYRQILNRIDGGTSIDEAFQSAPVMAWEDVTKNFEELAEGRHSVHDMHARSEAVSAVRALRKEYGDAKVRDVLEQAILKEPFVVYRK